MCGVCGGERERKRGGREGRWKEKRMNGGGGERERGSEMSNQPVQLCQGETHFITQ